MKTHPLLLALIATSTLSLSAGPALTIYNQNFAVVRETLPLELKDGVNHVNFPGVTAEVEPDSVVLRDKAGKIALRILEQSYRADAASEGLLLSLNEGKEIDFLVSDRDAREHVVRGLIVRSGYNATGQASAPIIEVDGKLRFSLPGRPIFPSLGDDTILHPTLTWQLHADRAAKLEAELGYITEGMTWQAAYNFVAPEKGDLVDIVGWVTVTNRTGKTFDDASVKLMAGDVNRVAPPSPRRGEILLTAMAVRDVATVTEKAFDEFHLYSLPRSVTLRDRETKQVEFLRATGVKAPQLYILDQEKYGVKIATVREFKNTQENGGLGVPLPQGRTRFYRQDDADGRLEFVGENTIEHTPRNETVRIYTGDVFDIAVERKTLESQTSNRNEYREETVEISLRNRKTEAVEVLVVEHFNQGPNWRLLQQSEPSQKTDARTAEFRVKLQPDEEKKLTYRVRYDWK